MKKLKPEEITQEGPYWAFLLGHKPRIGEIKLTKRDGLCFFTPDSYHRWKLSQHLHFIGPLEPPEID